MSNIFPLLIAEVANCHGGDVNYMNEIVEKVCKTSVDAVKFQMIIADEFFLPEHSQYKLFKSLEFKYKFWEKIVKKVKLVKKTLIFDIFGDDSLKTALLLKADIFKIHATDFDNLKFIKKVFSFGKPVYLSTGGASIKNIDSVMNLSIKKKLCLLVGFQSFPTPVEEAHLNRIEFLSKKYKVPVGYADHCAAESEFSMILPCLAVVKGAVSIEKHICLKNIKTIYDWQASLSVEEIDKLHGQLLMVKESLGKNGYVISPLEKQYNKKVRRIAVSLEDLFSGTEVNYTNVTFLRGENDYSLKQIITPAEFSHFLGRKLNCKLEKYSILKKKMFK